MHEFTIRTPDGDVERTSEIEPGQNDDVTVDLPTDARRVFDPLHELQDDGIDQARVIMTDDDDTVAGADRRARGAVQQAPDADVPEVPEPEVCRRRRLRPRPVQPPPPPPPPVTVTQIVPPPQPTTAP